MEKSTCFISLGSNTDGEKHLRRARKELEHFFPDIRYGKACRTCPVAMHNPSLFLNQIAAFRTFLPLQEVKSILKEIETACAALPKDKLHERICLDIDLLRFGEKTLKPEDIKRAYVQEGIAALSSAQRNTGKDYA